LEIREHGNLWRHEKIKYIYLERIQDIREDGNKNWNRITENRIRQDGERRSCNGCHKCRIGHFAEAQILQSLGVDMIDESEVLTPADENAHVDKSKFKIPFVCGCRNLGEALRRIDEGAAMIRTKGEAGTGDIVEAVRHMKQLTSQIAKVQKMDDKEMSEYANEIRVTKNIVEQVKNLGRLPVVNFAAGGIATPADASLMMQLGADGTFVGSGIFKSDDPEVRAKAIVKATAHFDDPKILAKVSEGLTGAMKGIDVKSLDESELLQTRGV